MKKANLLLVGIVLFLVSCNQPDGKKHASENAAERRAEVEFKDFGTEPFVFDIEAYTMQNENYRSTIWTGTFMQMTVMSLQPGEDIGLELHTDIDQFIRIEKGRGIVKMGDSKDNLNFEKRIEEDFAVFIPAGKWHNLINDSDEPLKLYSIYAPIEHPRGTIHQTREEGMESHAH